MQDLNQEDIGSIVNERDISINLSLNKLQVKERDISINLSQKEKTKKEIKRIKKDINQNKWK
jgi:hypothetical protein